MRRTARVLGAAGVGAAALLLARATPAWNRAVASLRTSSSPGARVYELLAGPLFGGLYELAAADAAGLLAGVAEPSVLEVGPGPGNLAARLARRVPGLRIVGVDIDQAMVERARARVARAGLDERVTFEVGDVVALPLADASVDLVVTTFSVHHWPDPAAGFAEIRRVLRPGGRLLAFDVPDPWGRLESRAPGLGAAARAGGFAVDPTTIRWPAGLRLVQRLAATRP